MGIERKLAIFMFYGMESGYFQILVMGGRMFRREWVGVGGLGFWELVGVKVMKWKKRKKGMMWCVLPRVRIDSSGGVDNKSYLLIESNSSQHPFTTEISTMPIPFIEVKLHVVNFQHCIFKLTLGSSCLLLLITTGYVF